VRRASSHPSTSDGATGSAPLAVLANEHGAPRGAARVLRPVRLPPPEQNGAPPLALGDESDLGFALNARLRIAFRSLSEQAEACRNPERDRGGQPQRRPMTKFLTAGIVTARARGGSAHGGRDGRCAHAGAWAILLGKANWPSWGGGGFTDNELYGRTSNPYDGARTLGGSSGGEAAIIAAGASPCGFPWTRVPSWPAIKSLRPRTRAKEVQKGTKIGLHGGRSVFRDSGRSRGKALLDRFVEWRDGNRHSTERIYRPVFEPIAVQPRRRAHGEHRRTAVRAVVVRLWAALRVPHFVRANTTAAVGQVIRIRRGGIGSPRMLRRAAAKTSSTRTSTYPRLEHRRTLTAFSDEPSRRRRSAGPHRPSVELTRSMRAR
jgi:Amidase